MDALINAAGRALAIGDALGALQRVALREDPPALALRGIAMAQLGELARARALLRRAIQGFGVQEPRSRARCLVAEAEVALAMREFGGPLEQLDQAAQVLDARGDRANAVQARLVALRRLLLLGRLGEVDRRLQDLDAVLGPRGQGLPPALVAVSRLVRGERALRALHTASARRDLGDALDAAQRSGVPALMAEVAGMLASLDQPAARCHRAGDPAAASGATLTAPQVEALLAAPSVVVDGCRHALRAGEQQLDLSRRPVLFTLLAGLARAWPGEASRVELVRQAFRLPEADDSMRARLRVEIGRLRRLVAPWLALEATPQGYRLQPRDGRDLVLLLPPIDGDEAALMALLADGAAWSTSALALALGEHQRGVQRALTSLQAEGRVRSLGRGRAQRWLAPSHAGFATILLLPAPAAAG